MAQSFNMISVSLGEAERQKDGKDWTDEDYQEHQKYYNINPDMTKYNLTLVSANGRNERDLVNEYFDEQMRNANQEKLAKVKKWNDEHAGKTNPKTGKVWRKKSVDKRQMYPVGEYAGKGKRALAYDNFISNINKGNIRAKESGRMRVGVLQQAVVGLGDSAEWENDPVRRLFMTALKDPRMKKDATQLLNKYYFKPFLERFEKENPSLHVVQAVVHVDESHPHMQFTFLPNVPGKEYGGLGSVGYTTALKHDHPALSKTDTIGEFYRQQHDHIRDLIANQQPMLEIDGHKNTMKLGARKGSHKGMRPDVTKQMLDDKSRVMQFAVDYKAAADEELKTAKNSDSETRHILTDQIKTFDADHMLDPSRIHGSQKPAKVSSPVGYQQHLDQPASFLSQLVKFLFQKLMEKIKSDEKNIRDKRRTREADLADAYQQGVADASAEEHAIAADVADEYKTSPDSPTDPEHEQGTQNVRSKKLRNLNQRITQESSKVPEKPRKRPKTTAGKKKPTKDIHKDGPTHGDDGPELG